MAMAFGLRYAPSQPASLPAGPQDSASAEAHCLQAFKAENTPAAILESGHQSSFVDQCASATQSAECPCSAFTPGCAGLSFSSSTGNA